MKLMYVIKMKNIILMIIAFFVVCSTAIVVGEFKETSLKTGIEVPILMYHSILKDSNKRGRYTISPSDLESDLKFLKEKGYTAVLMKDLIAYSYEGVPLPEKPVVLTFDDGHYNNYTYAYPLMEKYGMKFVISLVGAYTDTYTQNPDPNPNYAHISWPEAKAMQKSGIAEFQNHTYNLHSLDDGRMGCKKKRGEDSGQYADLLKCDIGNMQKKFEENLGAPAQVFTYPYGGVSNESFSIIKELGFKASLSCCEGINRLTGDPEELYMLKRCLRSDKRSAGDILNWQ